MTTLRFTHRNVRARPGLRLRDTPEDGNHPPARALLAATLALITPVEEIPMASGTFEQERQASILPAGTPAPDFTLHCTPDQTLSLSELRGRPVVLAFYPADWSPVCGDEMALFNAVLPDLQEHDAEVIGISVDGVWCHAAFAGDRHLHFPLLADFEPKGAVARRYGAYRESDGVTERALFVIDRGGVIRWSFLSPIGVNPGADGVLKALESLEGSGESTGKNRVTEEPMQRRASGSSEARP
jgi:peroxiredoxin